MVRKRSHILKVCVTFLLPPGIKGLINFLFNDFFFLMQNYSSVKQHIFLNIHLNAPVCKQIPSNSDQVVLRNNNFKFFGKYCNQTKGTVTETKWAPPYKRLVSGYKEETKFFSTKLPKVYSYEESELMKDVFKRFMDDGFLIEPPHINFDNLMLF